MIAFGAGPLSGKRGSLKVQACLGRCGLRLRYFLMRRLTSRLTSGPRRGNSGLEPRGRRRSRERNDFSGRLQLFFKRQSQRWILLPRAVSVHAILQVLPQMLREGGRPGNRLRGRTARAFGGYALRSDQFRQGRRFLVLLGGTARSSQRGQPSTALTAARLPVSIVKATGWAIAPALTFRGTVSAGFVQCFSWRLRRRLLPRRPSYIGSDRRVTLSLCRLARAERR